MALSGIKQIISGGQTGVDRAALDVAITLGIPIGGNIPKDRWSEAGSIPERYANLVELEVGANGEPDGLALRTQLNVLASDATLIIVPGSESPISSAGTDETKRATETYKRPTIEASLSLEHRAVTLERVRNEIENSKASSLNVAGPRESEAPGIYADSVLFLTQLFVQQRTRYISLFNEKHIDRLIDEGLQNLRHWDTIRWLVPFFYITLSGGALLALPEIDANGVFRLTCLGMIFVGLLCWYLIDRTIHYHKRQVKLLESIGVKVDRFGISAINWRKSATRAFVFGTWLLVVGWVVAASFEPGQVRLWLGIQQETAIQSPASRQETREIQLELSSTS